MEAEVHVAKDPELVATLELLRQRLGAETFVEIDHWPEDPYAIGVASPRDARLLAYISVSSGSQEPYFVSLEFPPTGEWTEHLYMPGDDRNACGLQELVELVSKHLKTITSA